MSGTTTSDGCVLTRAVGDKQRTYADVEPFGQLLVLGCEVGGRWSEDAIQLARALSRYKAEQATEHLRESVRAAWSDRWWAIVGVAVQKAVADSLLAEARSGTSACSSVAADVPSLDVLLDSQRWEVGRN